MATAPTLPGNFPDAQGIIYTGVKKDGPSTIASGISPTRSAPRTTPTSTAVKNAPGYKVTHEEQDVADSEVNFTGAGNSGQVKLLQTCKDRTAGHDHHPPRLRIALAAGAAGLALAAPAAAARNVALPSPLAPLSPSPPLGQRDLVGGERAAPDPLGRPGARLDPPERRTVRGHRRPDARRERQGRLLLHDRRAAARRRRRCPGRTATPGLRSTSIVWEGFNPLRRTLRSRATLVSAAASARAAAAHRGAQRIDDVRQHDRRHGRLVHRRRRPGSAPRATSGSCATAARLGLPLRQARRR